MEGHSYIHTDSCIELRYSQLINTSKPEPEESTCQQFNFIIRQLGRLENDSEEAILFWSRYIYLTKILVIYFKPL